MNQHSRLFTLSTRARVGFVSLFGATFLACLLASAAQVEAQQPNWSATGSLGTARVLHTATLLANGKVLVAGGLSVGNAVTASAELYDPATGAWTATGSLGVPRLNHLAVRLPNGKVLVAGGQSGATTFDSVELYDPGTGAWSPTGNLVAARTLATATLLANGKVLVTGGSGVGGALNTAELYDPATGVWSPAGTMNTARTDHTATLLADGRVLVASGDSGSSILHLSAELYDPANGSWTPTGSLGTARPFHKAILLANGKVLVVGGSNFTSIVYDTAELYDPATGLWSATGTMTTPRISHTATLLANGKVLVSAGFNGNASQKSAELYDPVNGSWTATAALNAARSNHSATLLANGKVLVLGGNGPLASAELFDSGTALPATTIQFSSMSFNASENAGRADITVTRSGDTTGVSSVDFATVNSSYVPCNVFNGVAVQNCDYVASVGSLSFAAGETSKTFTILVVDDAYVEGNETINLSLNSPTGASLGSASSAILSIVDNDSSQPAANPLDEANAEFFVRQQYYDFLNREPDQGGFDYWTGQITQCGTDQTCIRNKRIDVSNAFFFELEYQQTGAYVFRLYRAAYGNNQPFPNPDNTNVTEARKLLSYAAFAADRARVVGGAGLAQSQLTLASAFVGRPEFLAKYPAGLAGPQFVDAVLATIQTDLGVDLTSQRTALIDLFNSGGRGAVMYRLSDDNVNTNPINNRALIDAEYTRAFVATQYFGYLRRNSDINGFLFWLGQVNSAPLRDVPKQHAMVCSFLTAAEYQNRFSPVVTRSNAECPQ